MRIIIAIASLTILLSNSVTAQKTTIRQAERHFELMEFADALTYYNRAELKKPTDQNKIMIARCHRKLNNIAAVEEWYGKVEDETKMTAEDHYEYAQALNSSGKYKQAEKWYATYLNEKVGDSRSEEKLYSVQHLEDYYKDSSDYKIIPIPEVNTEYSEFGPCMYEGGILFVSNRPTEFGIRHKYKWDNSFFLDAFFAERGDTNKTTDNYSTPHRFNSYVNSKYHEGQMTISADEKEIIFGRNYYTHHAEKSEDNVLQKALFYAEKTHDAKHGHGWHHVKPIPFNNPEYSFQHPTATKDFETLYFSSDMPGGLGGADIWMTTRQGDSWSEPVNLGKPINTEGNEGFPFIHEDGTLYYVSDGHGGLGGYDIFEATKDENQTSFTNIKNMGYPINTGRDDFGLIIDDEKEIGYFASNRDGGKGQDDIYKVQIHQDRFELSGITYVMLEGGLESEREILKYTNVSIYDLDHKKTVGEITSDTSGLFSINLRLGRKYRLIGTKDSLIADTLELDFVEKTNLDKEEVELTLLEPAGPNKLEFTIVDQDSKEIISNASVYLLNKVSNEIIMVQSDSLGVVNVDLEPNTEYVVKGRKAKYLSNGFRLNSGAPTKKLLKTRDLPLEPIKLNARIVLNNVYFDVAKWDIREDAAKELDKVVDFILEHPGVVIELGSHTDSRGSDKYNKTLSQKRAESSVSYIVSKGIDKSMITAKGYGETQLTNRCKNGVKCSDDEHQKNRRTEIKITGIKEVDPIQAAKLEEESHKNAIDPESDYSEFPKVDVTK